MLIRSARADEAEKCADIHVAARRRMTYLRNLHTSDETRSWMMDVFASENVIVAELDGEIVGYASFSGASLSNMYVMPAYQRRGVGTALLEAVFRQVPLGVELWVFEDNVDAIRFYERSGFKTVSRSSGENVEGLSDRLMRRPS